MDIKKFIDKHIHGTLSAVNYVKFYLADDVENVSKELIQAFGSGNKLFICGNGGSAGDSQHMAAEMVVRLTMDRPALPAIALTTDTSIITATGNDFGYEKVFQRQVEALGNTDDVLLVISTSGNSKNLYWAVNKAHDLGMNTIGLLGNDGGDILQYLDHAIVVKGDNTQHIQEAHITIIHILCEIVEKTLFGGWK